jgi:large subunit ribosomal protein L17
VQLTKDERQKWRQNEDVLRILFEDIAPAFKERNGGYTRIVRMEQRQGDAAQKAILEWVDYTAPAPEAEEAAPGTEAEKPETAAKAPAAKTPEPAKESTTKKADTKA